MQKYSANSVFFQTFVELFVEFMQICCFYRLYVLHDHIIWYAYRCLSMEWNQVRKNCVCQTQVLSSPFICYFVLQHFSRVSSRYLRRHLQDVAPCELSVFMPHHDKEKYGALNTLPPVKQINDVLHNVPTTYIKQSVTLWSK